jgi:uncharacterized protein YutE (UPF0331/DUF86 family)
MCKIKKQISVPKSIINEAKQLTSISISKNIVCEHLFQAFVDKNFIVRGYQKLDKKNPEENLKDIFEEFWEFIADDNEEFIEFIRKDTRRLKL